MNALGCLLLLVVALLLAAVASDIVLNPAYFHGSGVFIANAVLLPLSLCLFLGIEKWGERITGYSIPAHRRLLIPIPAVLWLIGFLKMCASRYPYNSTTVEELCGIAMVISLAVLPFLLLEEVRTPVRFILGVWAAYILWLFAFVLVMVKAGLVGPP